MLVDYHLHPMGHGEGSHNREVLGPYFQQALERGINEIGIADHGRFYPLFDYEKIRSLAREYPELTVRVGVELPFFPYCEGEIEEIVKGLEPDFVIGSLHHIDGWMFDHPGFREGYSHWDMDQLYQRYFSLMADLVKVDSFDIIGHLDLIKVFGYRPSRDILPYVEPVLREISKRGKTVEVNTAGYGKPVKEIYPSLSLLKICQEMEIEITLGSDAHLPQRVGFMFPEAIFGLKEVGFRRMATFSNRERFLVDI